MTVTKCTDENDEQNTQESVIVQRCLEVRVRGSAPHGRCYKAVEAAGDGFASTMTVLALMHSSDHSTLQTCDSTTPRLFDEKQYDSTILRRERIRPDSAPRPPNPTGAKAPCKRPCLRPDEPNNNLRVECLTLNRASARLTAPQAKLTPGRNPEPSRSQPGQTLDI